MKKALCIGINRYGGGNDLDKCVNDANDWASLLEFKGFKTSKLLDKEASGRNIRGEMGELISSAQEDDSLFFTFSGHGSFIPDLDGDEADGSDEVLCGADCITDRFGLVVDDEIHKIMKSKKPGVRIVFISDSCHSGTVSRFMSFPWEETTRGKVRFMSPVEFIGNLEIPPPQSRRTNFTKGFKLLQTTAPCLLISGCQDAEYSYEGKKNGAFTAAAIYALKKMNPTSTYGDWYNSIREMLPSQQFPQTPNMVGTKEQWSWKLFS